MKKFEDIEVMSLEVAETIRLELDGYSPDKLRTVVKKHMEEKGLSQNSVSRAIGVSPGTFSLWLAQNYKANVSNIESAVKSYLQREREKAEQETIDRSFVLTSTAKRVFELARLCHLDSEFGVIYGQAGLGKTWAVREYARQNTGVILIEADPGWTARVVISKIHWAVGLDGKGAHTDKKMNEIIDEIKDTGNLLIIDEAENLSSPVINLVRRIHDHAGVGLLLVGMPNLVHNLRGRKGELAQLYSRAGAAYHISQLKPSDTEKIVKTWLPKLNGNLWKEFHEQAGGNARVLTKLILRTLRIASVNKAEITIEIIKKARILITV